MNIPKVLRCLLITTTASLFFTSTAHALNHEVQVTLRWTAPVTRVDGTPLQNEDILFYRINYGSSADPELGFEEYRQLDNPFTSVVEYKTILSSDQLPRWSQLCTHITSVSDDKAGGQIESGPGNVICRDLPPETPRAVAATINDFNGEVMTEFFPYDLRLTWTAPKFREDGTVLELKDISHYKVYYTQFASDPIQEANSRKLNNPMVEEVLWRFTVRDTEIASWTSLCGRVKTTAFVTHEETMQGPDSNIVCHVFSEPEPPEPPPGTIIDLEADVVTIETGTVTISTDTIIINNTGGEQ